MGACSAVPTADRPHCAPAAQAMDAKKHAPELSVEGAVAPVVTRPSWNCSQRAPGREVARQLSSHWPLKFERENLVERQAPGSRLEDLAVERLVCCAAPAVGAAVVSVAAFAVDAAMARAADVPSLPGLEVRFRHAFAVLCESALVNDPSWTAATDHCRISAAKEADV